RRHTRCLSDWSSDVCSSDLLTGADAAGVEAALTALRARLAASALPVADDGAGATGNGHVLFVYYSGHADAKGIHLAGTKLPFARSEERRVGKECRARSARGR